MTDSTIRIKNGHLQSSALIRAADAETPVKTPLVLDDRIDAVPLLRDVSVVSSTVPRIVVRAASERDSPVSLLPVVSACLIPVRVAVALSLESTPVVVASGLLRASSTRPVPSEARVAVARDASDSDPGRGRRTGPSGCSCSLPSPVNTSGSSAAFGRADKVGAGCACVAGRSCRMCGCKGGIMRKVCVTLLDRPVCQNLESCGYERALRIRDLLDGCPDDHARYRAGRDTR